MDKFEREYKFYKNRRFRFGCTISDRKIATEYEGIFSEKSRHTTVTGYTNDLKYNLYYLSSI